MIEEDKFIDFSIEVHTPDNFHYLKDHISPSKWEELRELIKHLWGPAHRNQEPLNLRWNRKGEGG